MNYILLFFVFYICCVATYGLIEYIIHKLFYKNCKRCKHCKLGNVASCGDGADYYCDLVTPRKYLNTRMVKHGEPIWKRCKKFNK